MTANELYREGLTRLEQASVEDSGFDCLQLFTHCTGISRESLLADRQQSVSEQGVTDFLSAVELRCQKRPLQYILGRWEFYSLPFYVGDGVLIPRADTEILVDEALRLLESVSSPRVIDLCSGSGCIAVSIGKNRPDSMVTAVEWSEQAYDYLQRNIELNRATNVTSLRGDVLAGPTGSETYHLVVSNPPYIPTAHIDGLSCEVRQEPMMALDGGQDGLDFYRQIIQTWRCALTPDGMMAFEVGIDQAQSVAELLQTVFEQIYIVPDLNEVPRVVLGIGIL